MPARQCNLNPLTDPIQPFFDSPARVFSDRAAWPWSRLGAGKRDGLIAPVEGGDQSGGVQS